jgi:hypothetical protein
MSAAIHALESLAAGAAEYDAEFVSPARDVVRLGKLGLSVRLREANVSSTGGGALFIGMFEASTGAKPRIGVVSVGLSTDPPGAANDAAAQWCLGVLPVLARGRGGHSCLVGETTCELPAGSGTLSFVVVQGPVIERGEHDGGTAAAPPPGGYVSLLSGPLRAGGLGNKLHWLECFAIRMADGSVDATCRLDNRDWAPGQQLLAADAGRWPGATPSFHSRRQFLLLLPGGSWPIEPATPSLWQRLFGRAQAG